VAGGAGRPVDDLDAPRVAAVQRPCRRVGERRAGAPWCDERKRLAGTGQAQRAVELVGGGRHVRADRDDDQRRVAVVAAQVAQDRERVAHEAALARVDLEALTGNLVRGAEQDRVADGQRRRVRARARLKVDPDAAGRCAGGKDE
jgi:hypothetical protein